MRYEAPESLEGAVALLAGAKGEARVLAGGTDLLVQMRADILEPDLIVDIKKIPETRAVTEEKGGWRVGAAVTGAELKEHPKLKQVWPGVVEAAKPAPAQPTLTADSERANPIFHGGSLRPALIRSEWIYSARVQMSLVPSRGILSV